MATFNCIVTNAGRNLIATAMTGGQTVNLINVKTGNGQIGAGNAYNLTSIINDIQDYSIDGSNSLTPYQTSVQFTVNSANVSTSYQMYEAGLMAKIGTSGTPTLLWYGYTTSPDTITPSGSSNATIDINQLAIVYSNATTCVATQTPTVTVPPHAVTHLDNGFDPIPVSTTSRTGLLTKLSGLVADVFRGDGTWSNLAALVNAIVFPHATKHISTGSDPIPAPSTSASGLVLANPNDVTQVYCGSNPPSWQPGLLVIRQNVSIYVATNGNDSSALAYLNANFPAVNNNSASPFLTIQAALNWLYYYFIFPSYIVTINVAGGVYAISSSININHPQGQQIQIIGTAGGSSNIVSAATPTGSVSNYSIAITVGNSSNIAINDWVLISGVSGVPQLILNGFFKVTNVVGNVVTILFTYSTAGLGSLGIVNTGTVSSLKTIINPSASSNVFNITGSGVGLMKYIASVQLNAPSIQNIAFFVNSGSIASFQNCGAYGFYSATYSGHGFYSNALSIMNAKGCASSNCSSGFTVNAVGQMNLDTCTAFSCLIGVYANGGAIQSSGNCFITNSLSEGLFSAYNGTIGIGGTVYAYYGKGYGAYSVSRGFIGVSPSCVLAVSGSAIYDLYAAVQSTIINVSGSLTYSTHNIAINTISSDGSYIAP